jgi:hypothetical protein
MLQFHVTNVLLAFSGDVVVLWTAMVYPSCVVKKMDTLLGIISCLKQKSVATTENSDTNGN